MTQELDGQLMQPVTIVVETLVMGDRWLKVQEIVSKTGISFGSVITILHKHFGLSKVCARRVPRFLTPIQNSFHAETSSELLSVYNTNPESRRCFIQNCDQ